MQRAAIVDKYGIKEDGQDIVCETHICPCIVCWQQKHELLYNEDLTWTICPPKKDCDPWCCCCCFEGCWWHKQCCTWYAPWFNCHATPQRSKKFKRWKNGLYCGPCLVKDAGLKCCIANICCPSCVFASLAAKAGLGACEPWWCLYTCNPGSALALLRAMTASKYMIDEGCCTRSCLLLPCSYWQTANEILVREKLTWGYCGVYKGSKVKNAKVGKAPGNKNIARA